MASHIWLNLPMDDHHFGWIDGAWTRHFFSLGSCFPLTPALAEAMLFPSIL
jgi:hypothetical protein